MSDLNPAKVPPALTHLLPVAEKWGISDDYDRERAVRSASREELEALIHSIDSVSDEELFGWLSAKEASNPNPTKEYVALTNLTMAIDAAKLEIKKRPSIVTMNTTPWPRQKPFEQKHGIIL